MLPEPEILNAIVSRVFRSDDITLGDGKRLAARYRGQLLIDSASAYAQLADAVRPYRLTPLFRVERGVQTIYLVPEPPAQSTGSSTTSLVMFVLTLLSVLLTGAMYDFPGDLPSGFLPMMQALLANLGRGWPFAVSLLAILGAHEFGHYLVGRRHGAAVTLPYFIPLPFSLLGTMGAFIQMKSPPRDRRVLLDIGIAGPLAGLAVTIPVLLLGLALSDTGPILGQPGGLLEGNSILYLAAKFLVFGKMLPEPLTYGGLPPALYWLIYFFTGQPLPIGGLDVQLHPVAWAGWAGLLVTAMNLIPVGQLDGGHVLYVLLGGERMRRMFPVVLGVLGLLGFFWMGWWLWAGLLLLMGRRHAEPLDEITQLDPRRRRLALLMLIVLILVFIPVPLVSFG